MFSEVCARRATPVRYLAARFSGALISGALLRCATRRRAAPVLQYYNSNKGSNGQRANNHSCSTGVLLVFDIFYIIQLLSGPTGPWQLLVFYRFSWCVVATPTLY